MLKKIAFVAVFLALAGSGFYLYDKRGKTEKAQAEKNMTAAAVKTSTDIGALARIEPRSRILRISHNAGPEGAKIEMLNVEEGQDVHEGDVLAVLADYPRREAELQQAKANIDALEARARAEAINTDYADKTMIRRKRLVAQNAISTQEYERSEQAFRQAKASLADLHAQIASAKAQLQVAQVARDNMIVKAPISGTVLRVMARAGERIGNDSLLEMADLTQLDAVAEVYERDIARVKPGQTATVIIPNSDVIYNGFVREIGFQVAGNDLNDTDPLADRDNRVISVRITLDDSAIKPLRHQLHRQVQVTIRQ